MDVYLNEDCLSLTNKLNVLRCSPEIAYSSLLLSLDHCREKRKSAN